MKPVLALDADGVMLNFHDHWVHLAQIRLDRPLPPLNRSYHFGKRLGLSREEYDQCWDYFREANGWSTVPAYPGVGTVLDLLAQEFELVVVTGIPDNALKARKENFADLVLPLSRVYVTGHRDNTKKQILEGLSAVAFVDDRLQHLQEASEAGISSLFWVDRRDEQDTDWKGEIQPIHHIRQLLHLL